MKGDLKINGEDAYTTYGINFTDGAISALLTPPPLKELIENKSRMAHGKVVINKVTRYDERDLTLPFYLIASDTDGFFTKYNKFCDEVLSKGTFTIETKYCPNAVFRLVYQNCTQFTQLRQEMALFSLKVTEPNPTNRKKS